MTDYTLGNEPTSLGDGYVITAPGVRGTVRISDRDALPREFGDRFDALLLAAGLRREKVIELDLSLTPTSRGLRSVAVDPTVLEVPRQPDTGALLLLENEDGAVSWHLPERPMGEDRGFGQEGGGSDKLRFVIPSQAALGRSAARGLGDIGKKLLKVFVYPITDSVLGAIGKGFVRMWEGKNRPYGIRSYSHRLSRRRAGSVTGGMAAHRAGPCAALRARDVQHRRRVLADRSTIDDDARQCVRRPSVRVQSSDVE